MIIVDLNLLIYATNRDAPLHERAFAWWKECLVTDDEEVGLAWSVLLGFVRLTTNPRVMPKPLEPAEALAVVDKWLSHPVVRTVVPTARHWNIVKELLDAAGTAGNLTSDAHLAALAIEHGARLFSADHDFNRFPGLRFTNPLTG